MCPNGLIIWKAFLRLFRKLKCKIPAKFPDLFKVYATTRAYTVSGMNWNNRVSAIQPATAEPGSLPSVKKTSLTRFCPVTATRTCPIVDFFSRV